MTKLQLLYYICGKIIFGMEISLFQTISFQIPVLFLGQMGFCKSPPRVYRIYDDPEIVNKFIIFLVF